MLGILRKLARKLVYGSDYVIACVLRKKVQEKAMLNYLSLIGTPCLYFKYHSFFFVLLKNTRLMVGFHMNMKLSCKCLENRDY